MKFDRVIFRCLLIFQTERLKIRPIQEDDANFIFDNWAQDKEITKYLTWKPHQTKEDTQKYINSSLKDWKNTSYTWIIEIKDTRKTIGSFAARRERHKLDVGYLLIKEYWGYGYMTEVVESFIKKRLKLTV